jgi:hypothetical protein
MRPPKLSIQKLYINPTNLEVNVLDGVVHPEGLISRGKAQLRENEMGDQGLRVRLHHGPNVLVLDTT